MKAYYLIDKVKRYHWLLRRAYEIIIKKHLKLFDANQLQIAIKAINDTIESNGLIPTLLIFRAYLRITELNLSNPIIKQKATIIKKVMKEIRKIQAIRKVNKVLRI